MRLEDGALPFWIHSGCVVGAGAVMLPTNHTGEAEWRRGRDLNPRSPKEAMAEFAQAWKTKKRQKSARIGFASPELLWKVLTEKR